MTVRLLAAFVLAAGIPAAAGASPLPKTGNTSVNALVRANRVFALKLYAQLARQRNATNLLFSPVSIAGTLGMAYAGARGRTARQIQQALVFRRDPSHINPAFRDLARTLEQHAERSRATLRIANALVLTGGSVGMAYKSTLRNTYQAEIFRGDAERINAWVARKTGGRIPVILDGLSPDSVCVLLNAISFKAPWERKFPPRRTRLMPFVDGKRKKITHGLFMNQLSSFRLSETQLFRAVSLPFRGGRFSMIVLLPNRTDGLPWLERTLTPQNIRQWLDDLDHRPAVMLHLSLPRFTLETSYDLEPALRFLGMTDAFDTSGRADFSGMGRPRGTVWISQIRHRAFLTVDEEGAEAAAAAGIDMQTRSLRDYPVFRADHPFVFILRDNPTGCFLFMGKIEQLGP